MSSTQRKKRKKKGNEETQPILVKPTDNYKSVKTSLQKILKDDSKSRKLVAERIEDAVMRTHQITILGYQFIRLFVINKYHLGQKLPVLDEKFILLCLKTVAQGDTRGPPLKKETKVTKDELDNFYEKEFKPLLGQDHVKPSYKKLNQILHYSSVSMATAYDNNIVLHFWERLFRYINKTFLHQNFKEFEALQTKKAKSEFKKELAKEIKPIKNDIINGTLKSDKKYHRWILDNRSKLIPEIEEENRAYDLKCHPQKYLPHLIWMNLELERMEFKTFQPLPLRNDIIPKYIDFDTAGLLELLMDTGTKRFRNGENAIEKGKVEFWNKFFQMDLPIFQSYKKQYRFNYRFSTDGIGLTLSFILKEKYGKRKIKSKVPKNYIEFPYLDDLPEKEIEAIKREYKLLYVDPGKKSPIYMIDDNNVEFRYTTAQRIHQTGRLKNQKIIDNFKKQHNIKELETQISEFNSKSCNFQKFKDFIAKKHEINVKLMKLYSEKFLRKLKYRTKLSTMRSESKMVRNIKNRYSEKGKKIAIAIGDWGRGKQMRNFISTPQIGIKRVLKKYFKLFLADEFRTSILSCHDESKLDNKWIVNAKGKSKKLHSVLVIKTRTGRTGCIHRDLNGVKNIRKVIQCYLTDRSRPERFSRNIKLPEDECPQGAGSDLSNRI